MFDRTNISWYLRAQTQHCYEQTPILQGLPCKRAVTPTGTCTCSARARTTTRNMDGSAPSTTGSKKSQPSRLHRGREHMRDHRRETTHPMSPLAGWPGGPPPEITIPIPVRPFGSPLFLNPHPQANFSPSTTSVWFRRGCHLLLSPLTATPPQPPARPPARAGWKRGFARPEKARRPPRPANRMVESRRG